MGTGTNIEIGIGGDLAGLRGRDVDGAPHEPLTQYRVWEGDFAAQFAHLAHLVAAYDPGARVAFVELRLPPDRAEEFGEAAAAGMPVRQFTDLYLVGGGPDRPDALEALRANVALARRVGTIDRLNMQMIGTSEVPSLAALCDFYVAAEELAGEAGITLFTETHVDRFTYDPRRLVAVHEALLDHTGGRLGLRVAADLSHYVHQLGNTHFPNRAAIAAGELNLDPLDPDNYVSRHIIATGLVGYGHLRMAVPNDLPRGAGSIQYPVVDPATDQETAALPHGGMDVPWWAWYREIFAEHAHHPERPVARFATEFIGDGAPGEYRVEPYRNLYQNIAMLALAGRAADECRGGV